MKSLNKWWFPHLVFTSHFQIIPSYDYMQWVGTKYEVVIIKITHRWILSGYIVKVNTVVGYTLMFFSSVHVFPRILPSYGPSGSSYLRRGCPCWIAESPFVGGCPYLKSSTTFRQLVAQGGTLGRRAAACCVFNTILGIAATLLDFLHSMAVQPCSVWIRRLQSCRYEAAGWGVATLRPLRGNAGTVTWLSAISEGRGVQSRSWLSHCTEILSLPVTQQIHPPCEKQHVAGRMIQETC